MAKQLPKAEPKAEPKKAISPSPTEAGAEANKATSNGWAYDQIVSSPSLGNWRDMPMSFFAAVGLKSLNGQTTRMARLIVEAHRASDAFGLEGDHPNHQRADEIAEACGCTVADLASTIALAEVVYDDVQTLGRIALDNEMEEDDSPFGDQPGSFHSLGDSLGDRDDLKVSAEKTDEAEEEEKEDDDDKGS